MKVAAETSKPAGKSIWIVPSAGHGLLVSKLTVTLPVAFARNEAGTTLGLGSVPGVIVTPAAEPVSIDARGAVVVASENGPVGPETRGFRMLPRVIDTLPGRKFEPPVLKRLTTWPATLGGRNVPLGPVKVTNEAAKGSKPAGNVTCSTPPAGQGSVVLKPKVRLPMAAAVSEAGTALVLVSGPLPLKATSAVRPQVPPPATVNVPVSWRTRAPGLPTNALPVNEPEPAPPPPPERLSVKVPLTLPAGATVPLKLTVSTPP